MINPAALFRAMADETRLHMLILIRQHKELCVCDLEHVLEIGQSKASRHLRYLLNAGLVTDRREAVWIYYRIASNLTADQTALLNSMERLVDPDKIRELNQKLALWREEKKSLPAFRNKIIPELTELNSDSVR
jgi:ArsR family transcriptional regulator, arsenate/arsenite/antimonite-responsive transcriptional repressor